jgi:hypothetical protein
MPSALRAAFAPSTTDPKFLLTLVRLQRLAGVRIEDPVDWPGENPLPTESKLNKDRNVQKGPGLELAASSLTSGVGAPAPVPPSLRERVAEPLGTEGRCFLRVTRRGGRRKQRSLIASTATLGGSWSSPISSRRHAGHFILHGRHAECRNKARHARLRVPFGPRNGVACAVHSAAWTVRVYRTRPSASAWWARTLARAARLGVWAAERRPPGYRHGRTRRRDRGARDARGAGIPESARDD